MVMQIGSLLKQREQQYVAHRDDNGTWRILNTWHKSLEGLDPVHDDIPDNHPAVILLTEGGFLALMKEAISSGMLEGIDSGRDQETLELQKTKDALAESEKELLQARKEIDVQTDMIGRLKENNGVFSESFQLKKEALDTFKKMAVIGELDTETKQALLKVING